MLDTALHLMQAVGAISLLLLILSPIYMPFVFLFMFVIGKGHLANKWWVAIKSKCKPNNIDKRFDYYNDPTFSYMAGNIYHKSL